MKTIGLCMIVKNEAGVILRCLESVRPLADYVLVEDTGSSDGTQEIIRDYLRRENLPGEVFDAPWRDFAHNRSLALARLRENKAVDYALTIDADDVLMLDEGFDAVAFKRGLTLDRYNVLIHDGPVTYYRPQLCSNRLEFRYRGVMHEFLAAPPGPVSSGQAKGFYISSRREGARSQDPEKYTKDAALLERALGTDEDPDLKARYIFYLAQSYRDAGEIEKAAENFARRAEMGDWAEEAWYARLQEARCRRRLGDEGGFAIAALAAFDQRPHRAEPLYDLANFHRENGRHRAAVLFAEAGLALPRPDSDVLFIEDFVYSAGLREEFSISAFYSDDAERKARGFATCNSLALDRRVASRSRDLARSNLFFYLESAEHLMPSFSARRVDFTPSDGYHAMNPSIARDGRHLVMVQRTVNSRMIDGDYKTAHGEPFNTRNFLLRLDDGLGVESATEILPPVDMPPPQFPQVRGFEDMRLFAWKGGLWCNAMVREMTHQGWCEQVLARIDEQPGVCRLVDWRVLHVPGPPRHEKNWMPYVDGQRLHFVYLCDPTRIIDDHVRTVAESQPEIAADGFRGGSQLVKFDDGWLTLVHEVQLRDGLRRYHHRFVRFDMAGRLSGASLPFVFQKKGVEYAPGLAWHPDGKRLLISYGVDDCEAWIGSVAADEVRTTVAGIDRSASDPGKRNPTSPRPPSRRAASMSPKRSLTERAASLPPVFIHSSWRTGSTWLWSKFREVPETLAFYEPFNEVLNKISRKEAGSYAPAEWASGHPETEPYYAEFEPLVRRSGGVRLFSPYMPYNWFVPKGGLRGQLRLAERRYLALLCRQAWRSGKTPVLGCTRSLGRLWPIKEMLGGVQIFLHRNLWQQWASYLWYRRLGGTYFYDSIRYVVAAGTHSDGDPFLTYLCRYYVDRVAAKSSGNRVDTVQQLEKLTETDVFALFVAYHTYLYLHAQSTADLTVDITRLGREPDYRSAIEFELRQRTGLAVSLADVRDEQRFDQIDFDPAAADWACIREHVRRAAAMLGEVGEAKVLAAEAKRFVDATAKEARLITT